MVVTLEVSIFEVSTQVYITRICMHSLGVRMCVHTESTVSRLSHTVVERIGNSPFELTKTSLLDFGKAVVRIQRWKRALEMKN
jgi:hypothetical protein